MSSEEEEESAVNRLSLDELKLHQERKLRGKRNVNLLFGTSPRSVDMSDASSYMSISSSEDPMDVEYERQILIVWNELGYLLDEVIDQGKSDCCLPACISECLTIALRWKYADKGISRISLQYLMDSIPRPHPNMEKCTCEDAYSFLRTNGAVFEEHYTLPFSPNKRNRPPGQVLQGPVVKIGDARIIASPTEDQLIESLEILEEYPLIGGLTLTHTFVFWKEKGRTYYTSSEDYILESGQPQMHAVLIVDYDFDHDQGIRIFRVKNSFGVSWGDGGYGWIDSRCLTHISYPEHIQIVHPLQRELPRMG